jgi:ADP-ribose pyrophosphatase
MTMPDGGPSHPDHNVVELCSSEAWAVERRITLLRRPPWIQVSREEVRLPDGRRVDDFYVVNLTDYVTVVAVTPSGGVVAERLYRHGPRRMTWAIPAGFVEPGEAPVEAARRELLEETGHVAEEWLSMGSFVVDGNRGCGWCHCFLATGVVAVAKASSDDLAEIWVELVPLERMLDHLSVGEVAELATAASLGLAAMHLRHKGWRESGVRPT